MVTCTGHIGIHEGADGRAYVRTDVHDVMAMKPNFLTSMGYHIFLSMVLRARARLRRARSSAINLIMLYYHSATNKIKHCQRSVTKLHNKAKHFKIKGYT